MSIIRPPVDIPVVPVNPITTEFQDFSLPQCWEKCFQWQVTKENREILNDIYAAGMEARRIKNIYSVNGTLFIIDNTLSEEFHDDEYYHHGIQEHQSADAIFEFQLNLMTIISIMMGTAEYHNPFFVAQFNERSGWTCDSFNCLNCCEAYDMRDLMQPVQVNATSDLDGNIEAACRIGKYAMMKWSDCGATIRNEMAIAIVNSDFHSHVHKKGHYDHYSPCERYFEHRYIVGTHVAEYDDLVRWGSKKYNWKKIDDNAASMEIAERLVSCMDYRCCQSLSMIDPPTECEMADGHYGEDFVPFEDHESLNIP